MMTRKAGRARGKIAAAMLLLGLAVAGCDQVNGLLATATTALPAPAADSPAGTGTRLSAACAPPPQLSHIGAPLDIAAARTALDCLTVKGRAPKTGYAREAKYGPAWSVKVAGCDTQSRVLTRDLTDRTYRGRCTVTSGILNDPYTGAVIRYAIGAKNDRNISPVQLDHILPLELSWQKGAFAWTQEQRVALSNDPANVLAVDGPSNNQKRAADAATWRPKNKNFGREYAYRIVYITAKYSQYGLWVTAPEKAALIQLLGAPS